MTYDVVVIGSGPGGYVAAIRCAQLGLKTACIEKSKTLGGTCLNVGCIPSKALLHSSELYWEMRKRGLPSGIIAKRLVRFSPDDGRGKKKSSSASLRGSKGSSRKIKSTGSKAMANCSIPIGSNAGGQTIEAEKHHPRHRLRTHRASFSPLRRKTVLSSTGALALPTVPKKILVIGAGVIGVELGSVYSRLGSEVVFIEFLDRICPAFDLSLSKGAAEEPRPRKGWFHLSHKVVKAKSTAIDSPSKVHPANPK